ncbi:hypothetical protein ACFYR2_00905 [Streptomyces microflavus]|uniref:hypothetical protein n=1 Tax=Streptomyces microflavus TaxID=1919 RepID=UPI0036C489F6
MGAELGPSVIVRRSGDELIRADGKAVGKLADFWRWACSDLANNTMRGVLAEYLVATALGAATGTRTEWDAVDIRTPQNWRIEVKSTTYLQSWAQSQTSRVSFGIAPASGWDAQTDITLADVLRSADVYVFCLLHHREKQTLDPLDLDQWAFYVLPTHVLDERCRRQKTITLSSLESLKPLKTGCRPTGSRPGLCRRLSAEPGGIKLWLIVLDQCRALRHGHLTDDPPTGFSTRSTTGLDQPSMGLLTLPTHHLSDARRTACTVES